MKLKHRFMLFMMKQGRKKSRKKKPWIGTQFMVKRPNLPEIEVFLYEPKVKKQIPMPVMFNIHGGAWVGGDATTLDTQSQLLADELSCFVVNINYTKVDENPFPYPQHEIKDTVLYFKEHANQYGIDTNRFSMIGYSAGGHLCAGAALLLKEAGFTVNSQFLCYPCLSLSAIDMEEMGVESEEARETNELMNMVFFPVMEKENPLLSLLLAPIELLKGLPTAELIVCGEDALFPHAVKYKEMLEQAGVPVRIQSYDDSIHGFLEVNFPETKENGAKSELQEKRMYEALDYIKQRTLEYWK